MMLRWFVAITPVAGAISFPIIVPLTIARLGLGPLYVVTRTAYGRTAG